MEEVLLLIMGEEVLLRKLNSYITLVKLYEEHETQVEALKCVPLDKLRDKSKKRFLNISTQSVDIVDEKDCLLIELLHWFKNDFFSWMDIPSCPICQTKMHNKGLTMPSVEEEKWLAQQVESYFCESCHNIVKFPRYNHPKKLLETRSGRCGEWANCFTLICRALGFEARFILDITDHVWSEVFSYSQNRWLHCDPCENVCDKPLLYELGWKKKLSYVLAFSKDEVQDVTWRYTTNFEVVLGRRDLCDETLLIHHLMRLTSQLQLGLSSSVREQLLKRRIQELCEFLTPPASSGEDYSGRQSGSLLWRLARGETGCEGIAKHFVFRLDSNEQQQKMFHLRYSASENNYVRDSGHDKKIIGWENGTYQHKDVFRKVEHDWDMIYLARKETCDIGTVTWKFDFEDTRLRVDKVIILCQSKTFENGIVEWILTSEKQEINIPDGNTPTLISKLRGSRKLTLTASLSGGRGPSAWQHAQLFRQPAKSNIYPLNILISFF
ncbi:N-glycanase Pngl isoform X2 [Tachypleus tridentatus]|uniref:N-glycanase Pngl isoform X2 n=1 Tax=Tachypleus tridentatus TaxID=6853 RepID=UPI003FCF5954